MRIALTYFWRASKTLAVSAFLGQRLSGMRMQQLVAGTLLAQVLVLCAHVPTSNAKPDALVNAQHQFSKVLPLCVRANQERRKQMIEAQNIYLDYEAQYRKILQKVPNFAKDADDAIKEQIAFCENVKKTLAYEVAKVEMHKAIADCQQVDRAFDNNDLVQAENLLELYAQQQQRIQRTHPEVLTFAEIKAETVHCDKRLLRAERWRELINQTTALIRGQAYCDKLATNLETPQKLSDTDLEQAQAQLLQTQNLLGRVQRQVEPLLEFESDFSLQAWVSYRNSVLETENCISLLAERLSLSAQTGLSTPMPERPAATETTKDSQTQQAQVPVNQMTAPLTKMMPPPPATNKPPERTNTASALLQKRCKHLINSSKAMRISAAEFETLGRAKAQFIIALERLNPLEISPQAQRSLHQCAIDLEVAFVTAEATLLEATQPQMGPRAPTKLNALTAPTAEREDAEEPRHPLLRQLKNLRLWRQSEADANNP